MITGAGRGSEHCQKVLGMAGSSIEMNGSHSIQKVECEGLWTGLSNYFVWFEVLFEEFL